jgi:hypothetical protein
MSPRGSSLDGELAMASKYETADSPGTKTETGGRAARAFFGLSVICVLMGAAPLHAATYFASANCGGTEQSNTSNAAAGAECGYSINYPVDGFIYASSEADATGLYVSAHGAGYSDGTADAGINDNFLVASGVLPAGAPGSLVFTYYVHGLTADPSAIGQVRLTADNPAMPPATPGGDVVFEQAIQGATTIAATSSLAVGVSLGVPTGIEVDLNLYSLAGYIDFSDTVELVGIEAFDGNGHPLTGDVTGDDGFDYTKLAARNAAALGLNGATTAPEASTWAMLLIGFLSLGAARLQRARRRPTRTEANLGRATGAAQGTATSH